MKKQIIFAVMLLSCISCFAQFATFEPIIREVPNTNSGMSSNANSQIIRATGYILSESGSVKKKVQLKVGVFSNGNGESCKIVGYYNIIEGFSANWISASVSVYEINGQSPISTLQKVAYANFTYWAYWSDGQIWFNL